MTSSTTGKAVLVVDDDPFMRDLGMIFLEHGGFTVETRADGVAALQAANERDFDLMILDMAMPGISGLDVLKTLRSQERTQGLPVLVLSAWSSVEARKEVVRLGGEWLDKPAPSTAIVSRARRMVRDSVRS